MRCPFQFPGEEEVREAGGSFGTCAVSGGLEAVEAAKGE